MYDVIIKGGLVVDGSGEKGYRADVMVKDGRIAKIGSAENEAAKTVIDAAGRVVTPGFIDYHSHSDLSVLLAPSGYNFPEQGTTTQITGHCGSGPVPYYDGLFEGIRQTHGESKVEELKEICKDYRSFMAEIEKRSFATNMAFYAGQGCIRGAVMGFKAGEPTDAELEEMKKLMAGAMEAGFLGFSTGLVYAPSVYAGEGELAEIAKVAHSYGGSYTSHIRGEGSSVVQSVQEALRVGEKSGIPVIVSHLKVMGKSNEGASKEMLRLIEQHNANGGTAWADQYPYTAGSAPLISQLPPKFATEGNDKLVEKLKDSAMRKIIEEAALNHPEEFESNIYNAGYPGMLIVGAHYTPQYIGKYVSEIAEEEGKAPFDVICDILIANNGVVQGIYFSQNESDMLRIISHPRVMAGSDNSDYPEKRPADKVAGGHPRGTGTMTRRIEILRDNNLLSVEETIHSMTGRPAAVAGIADKVGLLKEGMQADICVLDYDNVRAHADYVHPFRRNDGIDYVLLGGEVIVEHGEYNGKRHGRLLKHKR